MLGGRVVVVTGGRVVVVVGRVVVVVTGGRVVVVADGRVVVVVGREVVVGVGRVVVVADWPDDFFFGTVVVGATVVAVEVVVAGAVDVVVTGGVDVVGAGVVVGGTVGGIVETVRPSDAGEERKAKTPTSPSNVPVRT